MAGPWEKYGAPAQSAPAPASPPAFIPGTASPYKAREQARADAAAAIAADKARRDALEWNAKFYPDGRPKPAAAAPIPDDQMRIIRDEARQKIGLIDSLIRRSRNSGFTNGYLANALSGVAGTPAYDSKHDLDTLKSSGALQRVMEMSKANGGKNPLTPLSNSDFAALGDSITSLDQGLTDQKFQENLNVMRNLYLRAFKGSGGKTYIGDRNTGKPVQPDADKALIDKYLNGGR